MIPQMPCPNSRPSGFAFKKKKKKPVKINRQHPENS